MHGRMTAMCCTLAIALLQGCAARQEVDNGPDYVPGAGYHQIMAEVAASRGATAEAAGEYVSAAEGSDDPQFSRRAAQYAFDHGFDGYALRTARRWARLDPADSTAQLYLARLLLRRNDVEAATAAAERALGPSAGRTGDDYGLLADELAAEGNAEGATRVLTRLAARAPGSSRLALELSAAALRSDDLDLAAESARAAIAAGLDEAQLDRAELVIARVLLERGQPDAAIDHLRRQLEARPSLELEIEYAGAMAAADRPADALSRIDAAAGAYGREPELRRLRALVLLNSGDLQGAWTEFGTLVDDDDYADEAHYRMAEIAAREVRVDEALKMLARVGDGPYLLPAQEFIARIAEASGDPQTALQLLARLAGRYPQRAFEVARLRATVLQRLERNDEALAVLDDLLRYRPDDAEALLARGALLEKMQRLAPALADMGAAVRIFPDSAITNNALGYTLANRTRRVDEAHRLVRRALEREPANAAILDSYGWVLYRQGRLPEARSYLQYAFGLFPDPEVAAHLGEVMWKQGERDAARALWAEALEKSPGSRPLTETMARFGK